MNIDGGRWNPDATALTCLLSKLQAAAIAGKNTHSHDGEAFQAV
jgi:hypothetical protein